MSAHNKRINSDRPPALVKVSTASVLVSYVPYIGLVASWIVLFYMLKKETEAHIVELLLMVIISRLAALMVLPILVSIF